MSRFLFFALIVFFGLGSLNRICRAQEIDHALLAKVRKACMTREQLFSRFEGKWSLVQFRGANARRTRAVEVSVEYEFPKLRTTLKGKAFNEQGDSREVDKEFFVDTTGRYIRNRLTGVVVSDQRSKPNYLRGQKIDAGNETFVTHAGCPLSLYLSKELLVSCSVLPTDKEKVLVVAKAIGDYELIYHFVFDSQEQMAPVMHKSLYRESKEFEWTTAYSINIEETQEVAGFILPKKTIVESYTGKQLLYRIEYLVKSLKFPAKVKPNSDITEKTSYDRVSGTFVRDNEGYANRGRELDALLTSALGQLEGSPKHSILRMPKVLRWGKIMSWVCWALSGISFLFLLRKKVAVQWKLIVIPFAVLTMTSAIWIHSEYESVARETTWRNVVGHSPSKERDKTCGADSTFFLLPESDPRVTYRQIAEAIPTDLIKGTSLRGIQAGLASIGAGEKTKLIKPGEPDLGGKSLLHLRGGHFVARISAKNGVCTIVDPAGKVVAIEAEYLSRMLTGWQLAFE